MQPNIQRTSRNKESIDRPFLGKGWAFPLRAAHGDAALSAADRSIREAITIILETIPGERVMRPDFGVGVHRMIFSPLTSGAISVLRERIREALLRWEPRIDLQLVTANVDPDRPGWLFISLQYLVRETNTPANFVYPFYYQEAGARD